jgi:hypothetical protein
MAFASYEAAAGSRQKKLLYDLLSWEPELRMHEKAVQVALSIAAINREVGAFSATQTWLGGAREHMIRVGVMIERDAEQKVTAHNRRYGKGSPGQR